MTITERGRAARRRRLLVLWLARRHLALAMLTGVVLFVASPSAEAEDRRPCVSVPEFIGYFPGGKKVDLETRWDVRGMGHRATPEEQAPLTFLGAPEPAGQFSSVYRFCDYAAADAWVLVTYRLANHRSTSAAVVVVWPNPLPPELFPGGWDGTGRVAVAGLDASTGASR